MAKWKLESKKYVAQVLSVNKKKKSYHLYYMDGDVDEDVPEKNIFKLSKSQKNDKYIGKKFYDNGDYQPGVPKSRDCFNKGEFTVIAKTGGRNNGYWCERETGSNNLNQKRAIELFSTEWMIKMIEKYNHE